MNMISSQKAQELLSNGAILVDIREKNEILSEGISGAIHAPLSQISQFKGFPEKTVIYTCRSGMRTKANATNLEQIPAKEAYLLEGGINAWKEAGFTTNINKSAPIELSRQVQIVAGGLVTMGALLATLVNVNFIYLSMFVGLGLVFAGSSSWCGMANLLRLLPYNKAA